ncbi:hypothetical protein LINGRAHAP2_LOCUS30501 [Linum grandiflorum]
MVLAFEKRINF